MAAPRDPESLRRARARADRRGVWTGLAESHSSGVEIMAGILLWGGLGYLLDRWLGSDPWFFGFGVMLGFAGGLALVFVRTQRPVGGPDGG